MKIYIDIPAQCPICGSDTYIQDDFLYCSNPHCEGKFINKLEHFCGKKGLDIKGLSEATLQKLVDWGWVGNYKELFSLSNFRDEWIEQPGFGPKSVDKLLATIEGAKDCELWQFISALSIPLIGSTYAKEIAKKCPTWQDFRTGITGGFDFSSWDGFGYAMDDAIHDFDYKEADELAYYILHINNSLWKNQTEESNDDSLIAGKTFCITGKVYQFANRDEMKAAIEAKGGKVVSSVSGKTNYLITNDTTSGSAKNQKAAGLGIPIITEEQLIAML